MTAEAAPVLLELQDVHAGYGKIEVLKGVRLTVRRGEIVTIIGANGAGKTTTLMCVSGINRIRRGQILFDGRPIERIPSHKLIPMGICQIPEGRKIFPRLTVQENLEMGAFTRTDWKGMEDDLERVFRLFPILRERRGQAGGTLSGGEQQMLAIGRGLMGRPKLLLLDEPSLGIAPILVVRIFDAIRELNREGVTIVLVEQNARMALKLAHRGYVMETGELVLEDEAAALLDHPRVRGAYLGE